MKPIWIILISVIVTGGLVSGGTYYFVNSKADRDKENLQAQINDLSKKYENAQTAKETTQSANSTSEQTSTSGDSNTNSSSTTSSTSSNIFSLANLKSIYVTISGTSYKLTNGSYSKSNPGYNQPSSIVLDETSITIDSGNSEQAAVVLAVQYGGNGVSKVLEVMGNKSGKPQHISDVTLNSGELAEIKNLTFKSNLITVNMLVLGSNDSNSSPSVSRTVSYKLTSDSKLVLQ